MPSDPLEIVAGTADAAIGTDEEGRIVIWNPAAARLLGFAAEEVLGKACHEVLCGLDVFGNRLCDQTCVLSNMARRHEAVRHFEMEVRKASGQRVRVGVSIVLVPGPKRSQFTVLHLLQQVAAFEVGAPRVEVESRLPLERLPPSEVSLPLLTSREVEVLRLLADGSGTQEIADTLFISVTTVRNHVQNILRKLEVHSKLEAVSLALRCRLI